MACLRDSWRTSLPVAQQPRNPQSESIARNPYQITRKHEIHCGHRVCGHEGKCRNLHGHAYVIHFTCEADSLDDLGRVIDFRVIKSLLCQWLEDTWDHRMLIWEEDPMLDALRGIDPLPPIIFPGRPERWWGDEALKAETDAPQATLEQRHQAAGDVLALRCRGFFSAGALFSRASHMPVDTAQ